MTIFFLIATPTYLATAWLAFSILIEDMRRFRRTLSGDRYLTNGDVVFAAFIASIPFVGLAVACLVAITASYGPEAKNWASRKSRIQ